MGCPRCERPGAYEFSPGYFRCEGVNTRVIGTRLVPGTSPYPGVRGFPAGPPRLVEETASSRCGWRWHRPTSQFPERGRCDCGNVAHARCAACARPWCDEHGLLRVGEPVLCDACEPSAIREEWLPEPLLDVMRAHAEHENRLAEMRRRVPAYRQHLAEARSDVERLAIWLEGSWALVGEDRPPVAPALEAFGQWWIEEVRARRIGPPEGTELRPVRTLLRSRTVKRPAWTFVNVPDERKNIHEYQVRVFEDGFVNTGNPYYGSDLTSDGLIEAALRRLGRLPAPE